MTRHKKKYAPEDKRHYHMLGVIHLPTHKLLYTVSSKLKEDFTADSNESKEDD